MLVSDRDVKASIMKVSELSTRSGVPISSIKYYLREGLLQSGVRTATNQADYGEPHVRRLRLIRSMTEIGELPSHASAPPWPPSTTTR